MNRFSFLRAFLLGIVLVSPGIIPHVCIASELVASSRITVTDFRGKTISLDRPAGRIVCLIESALSGLYMLGAADRVVGISANVYQGDVYPYYAAMDPRIAEKSLPAPGNWDFVNIERVIALDPDLVIIWSRQEESIRAIEERGIPVFGVFIGSFEDIYREMRALGKLTGTSERAGQLIDAAKEELTRIGAKTQTVGKRPRVYFMWSQGELETSGSKSTVHELITLAGGENVCGGIEQEHLVVNMERVLAWDPEVIVLWVNERKGPKDILDSPIWQGVRAVRTQNVHELPDVFSSDLWTLKFQYVVKLLAEWCHPDVYGEADLEKERREIFVKLYGEKILPALSPR
ncbi:MAG TPA: ABC transporter substrate-binding protein [Syntrophobacteraceae bacterium]|nr:ABC transporter substrate-binding protein [Syntrophobacteraceae bacterium]